MNLLEMNIDKNGSCSALLSIKVSDPFRDQKREFKRGRLSPYRNANGGNTFT